MSQELEEIKYKLGQLDSLCKTLLAEKKSESPKNLHDNFNGSKAFSSVLIILSILGGLGTMFLPMSQRIDFLERKLDSTNEQFRREFKNLVNKLDKDFTSHVQIKAHPGQAADTASLKERFVEVETQFENIDERTHRMENEQQVKVDGLDRKLQIEIDLNRKIMEERIRVLERHILREPSSIIKHKANTSP